MADVLKVGDLVWAKMKGFSPWPGRVSNPTKDLKKPASKKSNIHCIFFFGTNNYAWIEENNIKPYFEYKEQLMKSSKSGPFKEAVQAIENFIQKKGDSVEDGSDPDAEFNRLRESVQQDQEAAAAAAAAEEEGASTSTSTPKVRPKKATSRKRRTKKSETQQSVDHQAPLPPPPLITPALAVTLPTPLSPVKVEEKAEPVDEVVLTSQQAALQNELAQAVASFDTWGRLQIGNTSIKLSSKNKKFSGKEVQSTLYSKPEEKQTVLLPKDIKVPLLNKVAIKKSFPKCSISDVHVNLKSKAKKRKLKEMAAALKAKKIKVQNKHKRPDRKEWYLKDNRVMLFYLQRQFEDVVHSFKSLEPSSSHAVPGLSGKIKGLPGSKKKIKMEDENFDPESFEHVYLGTVNDQSSSADSCSSISDEELMYYDYNKEPTGVVNETMDLLGSLSLFSSELVTEPSIASTSGSCNQTRVSPEVPHTSPVKTPEPEDWSDSPKLLKYLLSMSPTVKEDANSKTKLNCAINSPTEQSQNVSPENDSEDVCNIYASPVREETI